MQVHGKIKTGFAANIKDEKRLLLNLVSKLSKIDDGVIVTWRGKRFDLPFLLTRSLFHGIDASPILRMQHVDLAEFAARNFKFSKVSQERMCQFMGIRKKKDLQGYQMPTRYVKFLSGDSSEKKRILEHCVDDVRSLSLIYEKLRPYVEAAIS